MTAINHSERAHAILSPSSAKRWITCPPSARINEQFPDESSQFAEYGTAMHELAERCLLSDRNAKDIDGDYDLEQREAVQQYVDYVRSIPGERMIEQRLSFERWAKEGKGTCDAIVISDGHLTVVDLKGGVGVKVDAADNAQLMLYALSALDAYDAIYGPIERVKMVIHQPRIDHVDEHEVFAHELYSWAENVVRPAAKLAWEGKGEFAPSSECRFCKARHTCRARAEQNLAIARDEMGEWFPPSASLSDAELASIYPKLAELVRWANDLEAYCLARAESGTRFPGLKLVEGRSVRSWADCEDKIIKQFEDAGLAPEEYLNSKLIGIGAAEKLLGKKEFAERFADLVSKPPGKPVLVRSDDKRSELTHQSTAISEMTATPV